MSNYTCVVSNWVMHTSLSERCNHNKKEKLRKVFFKQYIAIAVGVREMLRHTFMLSE